MNVHTYPASYWWEHNRNGWGGWGGLGAASATSTCTPTTVDASGNITGCSGVWQYLPTWLGGCTPCATAGAAQQPGTLSKAATAVLGGTAQVGSAGSFDYYTIPIGPLAGWTVPIGGNVPLPDPRPGMSGGNVSLTATPQGQGAPSASAINAQTGGDAPNASGPTVWAVPQDVNQAHDQTVADLQNWANQMASVNAAPLDCSSAAAQLINPACTWGSSDQGGIDCTSFGNMLFNPTACNSWMVVGLTALGVVLLMGIALKKV